MGDVRAALGFWARPAVLGLAVVWVSGACAAGGSRSGGDPFSGGGSRATQADRQVRVEVRNDNFNEATIDARGVGMRRRLGRVGGSRTAEFMVDWRGAGQLYFDVDLLGGGRCTTWPIDVAGGGAVRLTIDAVARMRANGRSSLCDVQRVR